MKTNFFEMETELEKSMGVLKEIITVVMALAFTYAVIQFLVDPSTSKVRNIDEISFEAWLILFLIITTIVRFYHGNMRHLSTTYSKEKLISDGVSNVQLPMDFLFLIAQNMLFVAMGFYESEFPHLYYIFISLFFVDSIWFMLLLLSKGKTEFVLKELLKKPQTWWMLVNIFTVVVLWVLREVILYGDYGIKIFSLIIATNLFFDYGINWHFYFPKIPKKDKISGSDGFCGFQKIPKESGIIRGSEEVHAQEEWMRNPTISTYARSTVSDHRKQQNQKISVFVSAPFTSKLQENKIEETYKDTLDKLIQLIGANDCVSDVYSAHIMEEWGEDIQQPAIFVPRDYEAILRCNVVIAYLDGSPSMGMPIELGWALALKKSIIILSEDRIESTSFVKGFPEISDTVFMIYGNMENLFQELNEYFAKIH